jgi:hypothetical protein
MRLYFTILFLCCFSLAANALHKDSLIAFKMYDDVNITIDIPRNYDPHKKNLLILYALPNGNTTAQTMGKKMEEGDDWHFDIQHIKAQTDFIRNELKDKNIVVAYLENNFKSWPSWKTRHPGYISEVQHLVDTLYKMFPANKTTICLNGHSGGGRFIFSYLDGVKIIPKYIERIAFLDSNYGYEKNYGDQLQAWLHANKKASLQVFAYNDSVALYEGKRIVSDTGGTWYRSHLMLKNLSAFYPFKMIENDSLIIYRSSNHQIGFYLKTNPGKKIFHTTQVELNGFIHSILAGTKRESINYTYYGERAYNEYIRVRNNDGL